MVDTGGIDPSQVGPGREEQPLSAIGSSDFYLQEQIRQQAEIAIELADAVLFITDAQSGVTPADREVAQILRRHQHDEDGVLTPPVLLVVNKADSPAADMAFQFYELGMGEPYPVSAIHGTGTGDSLDALVSRAARRKGRRKKTSWSRSRSWESPMPGKSSL